MTEIENSTEHRGERQTHSDLGNARRMVAYYGHLMRCLWPARRWLIFRDGRWQFDDTGNIERFAKAIASSVLEEARTAPTIEERAALARWAIRSEAKTHIN